MAYVTGGFETGGKGGEIAVGELRRGGNEGRPTTRPDPSACWRFGGHARRRSEDSQSSSSDTCSCSTSVRTCGYSASGGDSSGGGGGVDGGRVHGFRAGGWGNGNADECCSERRNDGRDGSKRASWGWSGSQGDTGSDSPGDGRLRTQTGGQSAKRLRATIPGTGRRLQLAGTKEKLFAGLEPDQPPRFQAGDQSEANTAAKGAAKHSVHGDGALQWCQSGSNHLCSSGSGTCSGESHGGDLESSPVAMRNLFHRGEVSGSSRRGEATSAAAAAATAVAAAKALSSSSVDVSFSRCSRAHALAAVTSAATTTATATATVSVVSVDISQAPKGTHRAAEATAKAAADGATTAAAAAAMAGPMPAPALSRDGEMFFADYVLEPKPRWDVYLPPRGGLLEPLDTDYEGRASGAMGIAVPLPSPGAAPVQCQERKEGGHSKGGQGTGGGDPSPSVRDASDAPVFHDVLPEGEGFVASATQTAGADSSRRCGGDG